MIIIGSIITVILGILVMRVITCQGVHHRLLRNFCNTHTHPHLRTNERTGARVGVSSMHAQIAARSYFAARGDAAILILIGVIIIIINERFLPNAGRCCTPATTAATPIIR
jgi:hypothetical protein